jgi:hypothetical protein
MPKQQSKHRGGYRRLSLREQLARGHARVTWLLGKQRTSLELKVRGLRQGKLALPVAQVLAPVDTLVRTMASNPQGN